MPYQEYLWIFVWAFAAIALIGLEIATTALVSIWFAVGALAAFITAIATDAVWVQLVVFAVVSTLMLVLTRPFVKRFLKERKTATNADSLIGQVAEVSCMEIHKTGGLRHPVFIGLRPDLRQTDCEYAKIYEEG